MSSLSLRAAASWTANNWPPERVKEISKWPNREEQLSMLAGQILGPGGQLAGAIKGPGGTLASQTRKASQKEE